MRQIVTTAIVINRINFGEADRIITVITPDQGKLRLMAKGVRKVKSKLAGGIELFSISSITFIPGKKDISTLVSTRLNEHYGDIVANIERTTAGYEFLRLVDKSTQDNPDSDFFELLGTALKALNDKSLVSELVESWFLIQLLSLLGHSPNVTTDSKGQALRAGRTYQFDYETMAFFEHTSAKFNDKHIKLLRLMQQRSLEQVNKVSDISDTLRACTLLLRVLVKTSVS